MKHATCAKVDLHFQDGALPCDVLGDCVRRFGGHPLILRLRRVLMQDLLRTPEEWKAAQDDEVALVKRFAGGRLRVDPVEAGERCPRKELIESEQTSRITGLFLTIDFLRQRMSASTRSNCGRMTRMRSASVGFFPERRRGFRG